MTDAEKISRVRMWASLQGIELDCQKSIFDAITDPATKSMVDNILAGQEAALKHLTAFLNDGEQ